MINEGEYVPVPPGASRDSDVQHQVLQDHVKDCRECTEAIRKGAPRGFGQASPMCKTYKDIIEMFATGTTL